MYINNVHFNNSQLTSSEVKLTEGDAVTPLAGQRTCDSQVADSTPEWAPSRSGLGQATYTCVPLSPSKYNVVLAKGG